DSTRFPDFRAGRELRLHRVPDRGQAGAPAPSFRTDRPGSSRPRCPPGGVMNWLREPDTEPLPGYRLIEPLGTGGFGEVWKCEAPGGIHKAIKFVFGNLNS